MDVRSQLAPMDTAPGIRAHRSASIICFASLASIGLAVAALWAWQGSRDFVADFDVTRPEMAVWAVRCAAVAAGALAQVFCLRYVAGEIYPRRFGDHLVRLSAAAVCALGVIGAVALGLAGR